MMKSGHVLTLMYKPGWQNEEVKFHEYQDLCGEACEVSRVADDDYSDCPTVDCTTAKATAALGVLVANNCTTNCTSTECADAYKQIRYLHDSCDEDDDIEDVVGEPIHDYEDQCEDDMSGCNTGASDADPNACEDDHSAASMVGVSFALVLAVSGAMLA